MKYLIVILTAITLGSILPAQAQCPEGSWTGQLNVMGSALTLNFHITKSEKDIWRATMDSPQQGAKGIPVSSVSVDGNQIELSIASAGITYEAVCVDDKLEGTFKQGGMEFPLNMESIGDSEEEEVAPDRPNRPQEPRPPFPYQSEVVQFENTKSGIQLEGTLTMPEGRGKFPGVIMITGSGPQDRNSEVFGHKPFLVISDFLTRAGIAVLRYDERGVGASEGDFSTATSADFAEDAAAALTYLSSRPEINKFQTGIIGHSEGGVVAPMVTQLTDEVDFLILLAGSGLPGHELMLLQKQTIELAMGLDEELVAESQDVFAKIYALILRQDLDDAILDEKVAHELRVVLGDVPESQVDLTKRQLLNPWMKYFLRHDPGEVLKKVSCPVLVLNGGKDLQVPAKANVDAIVSALQLGGNHFVTPRIFPDLNHLFQHADTGLVYEYQTIEETFSEEAMDVMLEWITRLVRQ